MKQHKPFFLEYFNQHHKQELLESIIITCNNNDARILKIYLDFLNQLYPYNQIVSHICSSPDRNVCIDTTRFFKNIKLFKTKVNILKNFIENATTNKKMNFLPPAVYDY